MIIYKFTNDVGEIFEAEYKESDALSYEQVQAELTSALKTLGIPATCTPVSPDLNEVYAVHIADDKTEDFFICIKEITPGGRPSIRNEQRIQQKAKHIKYARRQVEEGKKAFLLGVYKHSKNTVFCTWKINSPDTRDGTPISKQIKIDTIAEALKNGFAQQKKGNGDYVFAFRKEFFAEWFFEYSDKCLKERVENHAWKQSGVNVEKDACPAISAPLSIEEQFEMNIDDKSLVLVDFDLIRQKVSKPQITPPRKPDYAQINNNKMKLGRAGERLVLKYERDKLSRLGINKVVQWVSEKDDTLGYDILSYDSAGMEIHIEVKTSSTNDTEMRFYLSRTEYEHLQRDPAYMLYYVFNVDTSAPMLHMLDIKKVWSGEIKLEAEVYVVRWEVKVKK